MAKKKLVKLKVSSRLLKKKSRRLSFSPKKQCRFCGKDQETSLDYKNIGILRSFLTERGKILPARISGTCCLHQRKLAHNIKKARTMALLPYSSVGF